MTVPFKEKLRRAIRVGRRRAGLALDGSLPLESPLLGTALDEVLEEHEFNDVDGPGCTGGAPTTLVEPEEGRRP